MVCELLSRDFPSWEAYKKESIIISYFMVLLEAKARKMNKKSYNYKMIFNEKC